MTEPEHTEQDARATGTDDHDLHEAGIDQAIAESQRQERAERDAALNRQLDADERVVRLLTEE